jgi:hypothetical protein
MVVYFKEGATAAFDKDWDALKLMNTHTGVPNLYAVATDSARLSIQALPYPGAGTQVVPLGLMTAQDGWVTFQAMDIQQMPPSLHLYLSDTRSGASQDLSEEPLYRLYLAKGEYEDRFFLKFGPAEPTLTAPPSNAPFDAWNAGGNLRVKSNLPAGEKGNLMILTMSGQVLYRAQLSDNEDHLIDMTAIAAGIYIVSFATGGEIRSKKIFIGQHP